MSFADGRFGASFFCSRDFDDRSNLWSILPTLAFQLAYRYPRFRRELLPVLTANPDVRREALCSQMKKLIVGPFQATRISTLIINTLDECQDEEPASALLSVLSRFMDKIPLVKFFITGRPEPRIHSGFRLKSLQPHTDVLRLYDVEPSSVDDDIKLFLKTQLIEIAKSRSDCNFEEDWPGSLSGHQLLVRVPLDSMLPEVPNVPKSDPLSFPRSTPLRAPRNLPHNFLKVLTL